MKKDDIQAVLRHGMTAGGGAGFAASHDEIVQLLSAFVAFIGLVWSIWEKRQRPPTPPLAPAVVVAPTADQPTKTVLLFCVLIPLMTILPGCVTSSCGFSTFVSPQRVESVTHLAAYGTASALLLKDPAQRENLVAARDGFHALRLAETWDLQAMGTIASAHGLTELSSSEGILLLTGAGLLTDLFTGAQVDLARNDYARAVVIGADDGLTLALGPAARGIGPDPTLARLRAEAEATRPRR